MTVPLYLEDTYLFHSQAFLIRKGEDEKGPFVILDQTIFYPQGGGQPSDQGLIKNDYLEIHVTLVRQSENEIRHYAHLLSKDMPLNFDVECFIDKERRLLNSRYHTAAHFLGNIVEVCYPSLRAIKGHSFPKEAYVEFRGNETVDTLYIQSSLEEVLARNDKIEIFEIDPLSFEQKFYKLPYSVPENKKFRAMQIGALLPVPCGGTHLSSIGEVGHIKIGKIKSKKNITHISYEV